MIRRFTQFGQKYPGMWALLFILWFAVLWWLSSGTPGNKDMPKIPHIDKVAHFGYFFGGGGLLFAWLRHSFKNLLTRYAVAITSFIGAVVGAIDEHHQSFTPGRTAHDFYDWLADTSGCFCGAIVMILVLKATSAWHSAQKKSLKGASGN